MANEIQVSFQAAKTVYALIRNRVGQIWSTSGGTGGFDGYLTASYADYKIALTEQGTASAFYAGNMPAAVPAGVYGIVAKQQTGGAAAETDPSIGGGTEHWNGSALFPLSDVATSGQLGQHAPQRLARSWAVSGFMFYLVSAADHVTPFVSGVVSGQVSKDGGAFGALDSGRAAAAYAEVGLGFYRVNLTSGDLNANTIALNFQAVGISGGAADPRNVVIFLQRVSGQ